MTLVIHHLQTSQSERLTWLCEELQIPYTLNLHQRDPIFSPASIKALHPLGQAPIIQDGPLTLAESGACVEYIIHKYGNGRFALPPSHPDYADYLYWFHFANSNFQPQILRLLDLSRLDKDGSQSKGPKERFQKTLGYFDARLRTCDWLAGSEFTAADIMIFTTLTTMRSFYGFELSGFDGILGYLKRVVGRDAWKRARAKAEPGVDYAELVGDKPPRSFLERLKHEGKL